jgi:hypothetical protein
VSTDAGIQIQQKGDFVPDVHFWEQLRSLQTSFAKGTLYELLYILRISGLEYMGDTGCVPRHSLPEEGVPLSVVCDLKQYDGKWQG